MEILLWIYGVSAVVQTAVMLWLYWGKEGKEMLLEIPPFPSGVLPRIPAYPRGKHFPCGHGRQPHHHSMG